MEDKSKFQRSRVPYLIASTFALAFLFSSTDSYAFLGGINEEITGKVLKDNGFDENSANEVGDSSYWTDSSEVTNEAVHVDNNRLDLGSQLLITKKQEVVDVLKSCQRRDALDTLGAALHTVQDVYAHSSAIDNEITVAMLSMQRGSAPCDATAGFAPSGLVSGYFSMSGFMTGNQCRDMPSGQCCHYGLNKDSPSKPNGTNDPAANNAARAATLEYMKMVIDDHHRSVSDDQVTRLENMLKQRHLALVCHRRHGGMSNDIAGVRYVPQHWECWIV
jgi:hypothetical protein